jgi:hypothetical protein
VAPLGGAAVRSSHPLAPKDLLSTLGWGFALFGVLYWALNLIGTLLAIRSVPVLDELRPAEPAQWPKLSVVIPACNEASTLEQAMRSKLAEGYPNLELVLVDDRSDDGTGDIVDRMARDDARVQALHIQRLPEGWLGKLNAMNEGLKRASGEWLLFSDADVHFAPGVLRRAVAYCEEQRIDHLSTFPQVWSTSLVLDTAIAAFTRLIFLVGRLWSVADQRSRAYAGVGAFNLVRRSALEKTGGFEWLKLEVADDMALGQMLKRAGARSVVCNGRNQVCLYFYRSLSELARGAEKGACVFRFSATLAMLATSSTFLVEMAPLIGALLGPVEVWPYVLASAGLAVVSSVLINRFQGHAVIPSLLVPLGSVLMIAAMARGGILGAWRGGVVWRGTHYPSKALLEGRRIEFP